MLSIPAYCGVLLALLSSGQILVSQNDAQPPASGPMLYIEQRTIDLGRLREGEKGIAVFVIENRGSSDLFIENTTTSCGCTVVELTEDQKRIAPGSSLDLNVLFNTKDKLGRQRNLVDVEFNDAREPHVKLVVTADVESVFRVLPSPLVNLRSARRGMPLAPLDVYPSFEGETLDALEVNMPDGLLIYEREPIENDDGVKGVRLSFRVPDEMELGIVNGYFTLHGTVGDESADVRVTVTGQVVGALTVQPAIVQSLDATPRGRKFAPLIVAATNELPFNILEVQAGPYLDATFESKRAGKEWAIRTTLRDDVPDGPIASTIRIRTDNDGQPLLEVPVFVRVRSRYMLEPSVVLLGGKNGKTKMRVRIQRGDPSSLTLSNPSSGNPAIAAVIDKEQSRLRHIQFVTVGVASGASPNESIDTEIVIESNIEGAPEVRIPVHYEPPPATPGE